MKKVNLMTRAEMKNVMGGVEETIGGGTGRCYLRCDQNST